LQQSSGKEQPLRPSSKSNNPGRNRPSRTRSVVTAVTFTLAALFGVTGCEVKSFIDPGEVGRWEHTPLLLPILRTLDTGIEEPTDGWASATDPVPADLVFTPTDYIISPNDLLQVTISDLTGPGTETPRTVRVADNGTVILPLLDEIVVAGLKETDLQRTIKKAYRDANLVQDANVSVTVLESRARTFSIIGSVGNPGEYQIVKKDFRLIDALILARDAGGGEYLYIYRRDEPKVSETPPPPIKQGGDVAPAPTTAPSETPAGPDILAPRSQAWRIDLLRPRNTPARMQVQTDNPQIIPPTPPPPPPPPEPSAAPVEAATQPTGSDGRYIMLDGRPVLVGGATQPATDFAPAATAPVEVPPMPSPTAEPFTFQDLGPVSGERVIRVPLSQLKEGDFRFNLVVRPGDTIIVPFPKTGVYYMGGHVQRTGVYSLTGPKVTLKQAVIAAGMLDQVAIPQRTDVIRRIGTDREVFARVDLDAIFAGKAPDMFLKPDDTVMVGTNFFAPFISAIRNGFRFSYGFGFFYDRNFGSDSGNNNNNN
jgi:polysaccharide biosynthesis/export protein